MSDLFAPNDLTNLRGKWILVCRTSGLHRIATYQRMTSTGAWSPRDVIKPEDALPHHHIWANSATPIPYQIFLDGTNNLDTYQEGYGANIIFLHPTRSPWVVQSGAASGWIIGDVDVPENAYHTVQNWINAQNAMKAMFSSADNGTDANGIEFVPNFPGKFDACVCYDDFAVSSCAHIAEKLNLITTPRSVVDEIKNKYKLRQICEQIGIPVPRSLIFRLTDLFSGSLRPLLDPTHQDYAHNISPLTKFDQTSNTTPLIAKKLPPTQRLNLYTDEWLPNYTPNQQQNSEPPPPPPPQQQQHSQVHVTIPTTPEEWTTYYETKNTQLQSIPLQYPLVIKPFSGAGSNFVRKAYNYLELVQSLQLFFVQCKDASPHNVEIDSSTIIDDLYKQDDQHSNAAAAASQTEDQLAILRGKWKYWGLPDLDVSFMIEECIHGKEFDLDIVIQDSQIRYLCVNDNYPTAGHKSYFQEAGGLVHSTLPFKTLIGCRVLPNLLLKYFSEYFLLPENLSKYGPCERPLTKCTAVTNRDDKCATCRKYSSINGIWHFEGMIANNMKWAQQYEYGILSDYSQIHGDDVEEDFYTIMPIEINQRMGGSEVPCLTSVVSGIDFSLENMKLHMNDIQIPNYFSLLPQYHEMNCSGFDRFPESPMYDPQQCQNNKLSPSISSQFSLALVDPTLLSFQFKPNQNLRAIPFPSIHLPTPVSAPSAINFDPTIHPMALFGHDEKVNHQQLHINLPVPAALQPYTERLSYLDALTIAETYTTVLKLPLPTAYYSNVSDFSNPHPRWNYVSSINWVPYISGRIDTLELPPHVIADPSYLGSLFWYTPGTGQSLIVPPHGFDFLGWLVAGGNTPMEAHFNLLRLSAELRYWIEPIQDSSPTK